LLFEILGHDPRYAIKVACLDGINALINEKSVIPIEFERNEVERNLEPNESAKKKRKRETTLDESNRESADDLKKKKVAEFEVEKLEKIKNEFTEEFEVDIFSQVFSIHPF
jgi:hypothetical protein